MLAKAMTFMAWASGAVSVLALVLWATTSSQFWSISIPMPAGRLAGGFCNQCLVVAVLDDPPPLKHVFWRMNRRSMGLEDIHDGWDFKSDLWSWGISIPFSALAIAFAIAPLWWLVVYRDRHEMQRRVQMGLCVNCGYDPRGTPGIRCSECGANPRTGILPPETELDVRNLQDSGIA
jgi:hypothetical protein